MTTEPLKKFIAKIEIMATCRADAEELIKAIETDVEIKSMREYNIDDETEEIIAICDELEPII